MRVWSRWRSPRSPCPSWPACRLSGWDCPQTFSPPRWEVRQFFCLENNSLFRKEKNIHLIQTKLHYMSWKLTYIPLRTTKAVVFNRFLVNTQLLAYCFVFFKILRCQLHLLCEKRRMPLTVLINLRQKIISSGLYWDDTFWKVQNNAIEVIWLRF